MSLRTSTKLVLLSSLFFSSSAFAVEPEVVPGEYIVKFKNLTSSSQAHKKIVGKGGQLKGAFSGRKSFHLKFDPKDKASVEALKNDPEVEYIEPNYVLRSTNEDQPGVMLQSVTREEIQRPSGMTDQAVSAQTAGVYDQSGANTHTTEAWAESLPYDINKRTIVAVIDTGLDSSHTVFTQSSAVWLNLGEIPNNGVDDDFNGYVDDIKGWNFINATANFYDDQGHGTHVSGIVLGATMDILKAPPLDKAKIQIMPLKFLDANGSGSTSNAISAMYYAVNNGAKVINCSWGGSAYSRALHEAMTYAYSHGVLVVSAAGNYARNNDASGMYPANYDVPSNLSVAASNDYDYLASFSNFGVASVPVSAPGVLIYSTAPGGTYALMSGTSMAAPFVAGAAALSLREAIQLSGYQLKGMILSSATRFSQLNGKVGTGARIDSLYFINTVKGQSLAASSQPNYEPAFKVERGVASDSSSSNAAAGCGLIAATELLGPGAGGGSFSNMSWLAIFLLIPVIFWFSLRQGSPQSRRKYDRFRMNSSIKVMLGDRELSGQIQTISLGGLSFNADEALQKGHTVTMKIASPDGKEMIEVEGSIVWSEASKNYGVKFAETKLNVLDKINMWTRQLSRATQ